jgi:very-short-patch-repair endonuclease
VIDTLVEGLNLLERQVYMWLSKKEIPFSTQVPMFGVQEPGSATVDFILTDRGISLRVMGEYWHRGLQANARDLLGRERLTEAGYIVVDIWERDLRRDFEGTMQKAIRGEEALR